MPVAVIPLPKATTSASTWTKLVAKSRAIRLAALEECPLFFGSSYERELAFASDVWEQRLTNPLAQTFVATFSSSISNDADLNTNIASLVNELWVGSIVLTGPHASHDVKEPIAPSAMTIATLDDSLHRDAITADIEAGITTPHYFINGMYVLHLARGTDVGGRLVEACVMHGRERALETAARAMRFTLLVDGYNARALQFYSKQGFDIMKRYWFDDVRAKRNEDGSLGRTEAAVMERVEVV